jgi:GNAT superfamily N-acetyltransferase
MIRQATIWDAEKIARLWGKLIEEVNIEGKDGSEKEQEKFFIHLLARIKKDDSCVLVIEIDNEIVGFATIDYFYCKYGSENMIGLCDNIYIEKEHRNKNLMTPMIDWMITYGKSYGMTEVQFETVYDPSLIKVWKKKGFKPIQVKYQMEV